MIRVRPYIPLPVRVTVARRQLAETIGAGKAVPIIGALSGMSNARQLRELLFGIFGEQKVHLDHSPALILRPYNPRIKDPAARYTPNANDPDALIYRTVHNHNIKSNVRGDGAQRSDTSQRMHERKIERNKAKRAAKANRCPPLHKKSGRKSPFAQFRKSIPSRPFPQQSRAFRNSP